VAEQASGATAASPAAAQAARTLAGLLAVAATYVSFLLWDQFGFLALLRDRLGEAGAPGSIRLTMAAMGTAGLAVSLITAPVLAALDRRLDADRAARLPVIAGLVLSAVAPLAGLACRSSSAFVAAAALVGGATAFLTVALAARLRGLLPVGRPGLAVGAATGVAYLLCNVPGLYDAAPAVQAVTVAALCLVAAGVLGAVGQDAPATAPSDRRAALPARLYTGAGLAAAVLSFTLLVGLDSAVFAHIQQTPALEAATWGAGGGSLRQGVVHLLAALGAGALLDATGGLFGLLLVGTGALFAAGFTLFGTFPGGSGALLVTGAALYAIGISTYSVALVLYPAGNPDEPGALPARWRSALVYGLAGWVGSALGVGMAQNLHRVPRGVPVAVLAALATMWVGAARGGTGPGRRRRRQGAAKPRGAMGGATLLLAAIGVLAVLLYPNGEAGRGGVPRTHPGRPSPTNRTRPANRIEQVDRAGRADHTDREAAAARGRQVYIAEGCIHCHSEYVRPGTRDQVLWGPHRQQEPAGTPPLIGVRRQGPDLTNVGARRTAAWQRLHLIDPRALIPGSRMPSYAALFAGDGRRGADLVAYLQSLGRGVRAARKDLVAEAAVPERAGSAGHGRELFGRYCAACHGARGRGDGRLAAAERGPDPTGDVARTMDLTKGAFWAVSWSPRTEPLEADIARTIRFGIPGTPMPGHEALTDEQVRDLVAYVEALAHRGQEQRMAAARARSAEATAAATAGVGSAAGSRALGKRRTATNLRGGTGEVGS